MFNKKLMSPGWEKDKDSVCNVCECFHARNRVPTVPEKQIDKMNPIRA